jgi:type II secretory ATPase GspE/PulE/Tfp pilus assembly ATPase PilB-like protein
LKTGNFGIDVMSRKSHLLLVLLFFAAVFVLQSGPLAAQEPSRWEPFPLEDNWRGPGFYLSWIKVLSYWLVFLAFVFSADWANRDLREHKVLSHLRWNPIICGTFLGTMVLLWFLPIPWFSLGFVLLLAAYIVPFAVYVRKRNSRLDGNLRVFTPAHLRYCLSRILGRAGIKIAAERPDPDEIGPPVKLSACGGSSDEERQERTTAARHTAGMAYLREIFSDALAVRASSIVLDYAQDGAAARYMVDGVWTAPNPLTGKMAEPALETLKILCGLDPKDRSSRADGAFSTSFNGVGIPSTLTCQKTQTGRRAAIQFAAQQKRFDSLESLGMREKVRELIAGLMDEKKGILLFSSLPGNGLRSTMSAALRNTDRLMREFAAVEDEANRYEPIENITVATYKSAAGESPASALPKLLRTDPNAIIVRDLVNLETVGYLCREVAPKRLVISNVRAKDGVEALLRVLAMKVPPAEFANAAIGVVHQRLIRKLCPECKQKYSPTPEELKQLGIPADRAVEFHRPPAPPPANERKSKKDICSKCAGIGYRGRTAIFEVILVGDEVRNALATAQKMEPVRAAARKDGAKTAREDGLLLVTKGVTSAAEYLRVMK